jgi:hypothetical protein
MSRFLLEMWRHDGRQDIAEYAVMLAVIRLLVVWHDSPDRKQREHRSIAPAGRKPGLG